MIQESDIILRVLFAALLGLIIGFERERQDHSAGLRTHMVLVIGAALAMPVSINIAIQFADTLPGGDPARLAAQVVSGVGFLGAGVIFRYGSNVRGLTTAASLWTIAIVGLAVGAGFFWSGAVITFVLLFILTIMNQLEDHLIATYNRLRVTVWGNDRPGLTVELKQLFEQKKYKMSVLAIEKDLAKNEIVFDVHVRLPARDDQETVIYAISSIEGVERVKISE